MAYFRWRSYSYQKFDSLGKAGRPSSFLLTWQASRRIFGQFTPFFPSPATVGISEKRPPRPNQFFSGDPTGLLFYLASAPRCFPPEKSDKLLDPHLHFSRFGLFPYLLVIVGTAPSFPMANPP